MHPEFYTSYDAALLCNCRFTLKEGLSEGSIPSREHLQAVSHLENSLQVIAAVTGGYRIGFHLTQASAQRAAAAATAAGVSKPTYSDWLAEDVRTFLQRSTEEVRILISRV